MSLVPIIYTSLVLFFGMLLIVWMISYISFKRRAQANPVIEEEKLRFHTYLSMTNSIANGQTKYTHNRDRSDKVKLNIKQTHHEFSKHQTNPLKKTRSTSTRVRIVNKPTKTEIQSINNKPKETNPGMDLSQLNMFSFYSDLFEIDLVPAVISPINKAV